LSSAIPTLALGVSRRLLAVDFRLRRASQRVTISIAQLDAGGREALDERHAVGRNILTAGLLFGAC
jgi:hypothetical protein